MTTIPTSTFDVDSLRRAVEARDASALAGLYADDATVEIVDHDHGPSEPQRFEGIDAIRAHLEDVFGRDMSHELAHVVASDDALGYSLRCRYPDGMRVVCAATASVSGGKIVSELGVQAWDA